MEDTHGGPGFIANPNFGKVLILIIMEDTHGVNRENNISNDVSES